MPWRILLVFIFAMTLPGIASAFQPCPPGTAPSMVGPLTAGLVIGLGGGGFSVHKAASSDATGGKVGWSLGAAGFVLVGAAVGLGYAMYQGAVGTCIPQESSPAVSGLLLSPRESFPSSFVGNRSRSLMPGPRRVTGIEEGVDTVDSLNLATAAGIALFASSRR
jgi:hypothetical protein